MRRSTDRARVAQVIAAAVLSAALAAAADLPPGFFGVGDLPGRDFYSVATSVSNDNKVVGYSYTEIDSEAFIWTWRDGMVRMNVPFSRADAISGDGSTIVGLGPQGPCYWRLPAGPTYLSVPPGGGRAS